MQNVIIQCVRCVAHENNSKVLCFALGNVLSSFLQSALLRHNLLSSTMLDVVFSLNPCDLRTANNEIDEKQRTIA